MRLWAKHPLIYEINTWVWLDELSRKAAKSLTLASVPDEEWDRIASLGFDAVWLMGVWERSPAGLRISMANDTLIADFRRALSDFTEQDNAGSPYCIRRYAVDAQLGGPEGLVTARKNLARRGMLLILDFVPNHVAPDHPWIAQHPEYFMQGSSEDLEREPHSFMALAGGIYACGRDPYFPAWPDVIQVNAFDRGLRSAMIATLSDIAGQCDGVRCDMAMLMINSVFGRTWGSRAGSPPEGDYWPAIISAVKEKHPDFRFMAEAYWDLEWELQQHGFDYCYDKRLYDRLEHGPAESVRQHLCAHMDYQERLVRFIENHDEPRAAAVFDAHKHRAVALTALTLPGARLVHEGQLEGRRVRVPVFLGRRPEEPPDLELLAFYGKLFRVLRSEDFIRGTWRLCVCAGWPDNNSYLNLISWSWEKGSSRCLIVVNLSGTRSQGWVEIPWDDLKGHQWRLEDVFMAAVYERDGDELEGRGLYVDLPAWEFHFLIASQERRKR